MRRGGMDQGVTVLLCPSWGKTCGIARYTAYVQAALERSGAGCVVVRDVAELRAAVRNLDVARVIVQHEYGLFDYNSRLAGPDTTASLVAALNEVRSATGVGVMIVMHTIVLADHVLTTLNKQLFAAGLPIAHLTAEGARFLGLVRLEHGVPVIEGAPLDACLNGDRPEPARLRGKVAGVFGMASDNKNTESVLAACKEAGWSLVAQVATAVPAKRRAFMRAVQASGVQAQLHFDFAPEDLVAQRLSQADAFIVNQESNAHFATTGSARFLMNFLRPMIVNPARQYLDLGDSLLVRGNEEVADTLVQLALDGDAYAAAAAAVTAFARDNTIAESYRRLIEDEAAWTTAPTVKIDREGYAIARPSMASRLAGAGLDRTESGPLDSDAVASEDRAESAPATILADLGADTVEPERLTLTDAAQAAAACYLSRHRRHLLFQEIVPYLAVSPGRERSDRVALLAEMARRNEVSADRFVAETDQQLEALLPVDALGALRRARAGLWSDEALIAALVEALSRDAAWSAPGGAFPLGRALVAPEPHAILFLRRVARVGEAELLDHLREEGPPPWHLFDRLEWLRLLATRLGREVMDAATAPSFEEMLERRVFFDFEFASLTDDLLLAAALMLRQGFIPGYPVFAAAKLASAADVDPLASLVNAPNACLLCLREGSDRGRQARRAAAAADLLRGGGAERATSGEASAARPWVAIARAILALPDKVSELTTPAPAHRDDRSPILLPHGDSADAYREAYAAHHARAGREAVDREFASLRLRRLLRTRVAALRDLAPIRDPATEPAAPDDGYLHEPVAALLHQGRLAPDPFWDRAIAIATGLLPAKVAASITFAQAFQNVPPLGAAVDPKAVDVVVVFKGDLGDAEQARRVREATRALDPIHADEVFVIFARAADADLKPLKPADPSYPHLEALLVLTHAATSPPNAREGRESDPDEEAPATPPPSARPTPPVGAGAAGSAAERGRA